MRLTLRRDLVPLKEAAKRAVDEAAEVERLRYITSGDGQAMAYRQKYEEARGLLNGTHVEPPHIVSEAAMRGISPESLARLIVDKFHEWQTASATIETKRLAAKAAINAATTPTEIEQVKYD